MSLVKQVRSSLRSRYLHRILKERINTFINTTNSKESTLAKNIVDDFRDVKFAPLSVEKCLFERSFSEASFNVLPYIEDTNGTQVLPQFHTIQEFKELLELPVGIRGVNFSSLFKEGFSSIQNVGDGTTKQQQEIFSAVQAFESGFLKNKAIHEASLDVLRDATLKQEDVGASILTALLANHLFSGLGGRKSGHPYLICNDEHEKYLLCPCTKSCRQQIKYGRHGIGSEYFWYGKPDIMLFTNGCGLPVCSILVASDQIFEDEAEPDPTEGQIDIRSDDIVQQAVAQTITFSFYHRIHQLRNKQQFPSPRSLIPTIVISQDNFDVYFYDSEYDILLRNEFKPLPLWDFSEVHLNLSSILLLWMVIHHSTFKPSFSEYEITELRGTCGLKNEIESSQLKKIMETIKMKQYFDNVKNQRQKFYSAIPFEIISQKN